jgi:hypothetical protein
MEFDGKIWSPYEAEPSLPTNIIPPYEKVLEGFDVVTFMRRMHLSARLFLATEWQKKFGRINPACWNRLPRLTINLTAGRSTTLNRDHTASSRFIQFNGHDPVARVGVTQAVIVGNQNAILWTDHRLLPDRT